MSAPERSRSTWIDRAIPEAIGSPTAQSLNAFAGIIGILFVLNTYDSTSSYLLNLLFAVTIQSIAAIVIAISCATIFTSGSRRATGIVMAGSLRGFLVSLILIQGPNGFSVGQGITQILGSIVFTSLWLLAAGYIVQGTRDYRATFAARFEQAVAAGSQNSHESTPWTEAQNLATAEKALAQSRLDNAVVGLDNSFDPELSRNMLAIAGEIHAAALDRVRPVSHRMWDQGSQRPPSLRVRAVINRALKIWQAPIPLAVISAALVTGFGASVSRDLPVGLFTGANVALVAAVLLFLRQWMQQREKPHEVAAMLLLLAIAPVTFVVLEYSGRAIGLPSDLPGVFVVSIASLTLSFVVIALSGISQHRTTLIAEMDYLLSSGFWQTQVGQNIESRHSNDAATYLHHKVQSQLLAVALQLEMAAQSNDQSELIATIHKARSILSESTNSVQTNKNLYASILRLPNEWDGICTIDLHLPPETGLPPNTWNLIDMLLRELVANAVRSGHATVIKIEIKLEDPDQTNNIDVTINDNGTGPSHAQSGLGTTWLHTIARNVRISQSPLGGMDISLQLPVIY